MFKRGFLLAACGALALLLTAAESTQAQVFFPNRGGAFLWPGLSYPVGPTYANYPHPFIYNPPPTSASGVQQYSASAPTQMYYGAATPMFYGNYSPGYSTVRGGLVSPPVGLTAASNVGEAAYSTPSYPIQSPNYGARYPASPSSAITDNTAEVVVRLPADAELWFEGQKTVQTGSDRIFRSPDLAPGEDYVYSVHARWQADGKPVDETRKVTVHAGDRVVVNLAKPAK